MNKHYFVTAFHWKGLLVTISLSLVLLFIVLNPRTLEPEALEPET